jgi:hypothetical protein
MGVLGIFQGIYGFQEKQAGISYEDAGYRAWRASYAPTPDRAWNSERKDNPYAILR